MSWCPRALTCLLLLLPASALADGQPVVFWTVDAEGGITSHWLDEHGALTRPGLWMIGQGELVQVTGASSEHRLCDCEAWAAADFEGDCRPQKATSSETGLVQLGPGKGRGAVSAVLTPEAALDLGDYGSSVRITGSAGPWLFVEAWTSIYGCGAAHPNSSDAQWMWHVGEGRRVDVFGGLVGDAEARQLVSAGETTATRLLEAREMVDEAEPEPVALRPGWSGGSLSLDAIWSTWACYACGDGVWGSYSASVHLPAGLVPGALSAWTKVPARVVAFLGEHPELRLGGWSSAPAAQRERFASPKFRYPVPPGATAPKASLERPVDAVFGYYEALAGRRPDEAFARFAFPGWDRAKWDRVLWAGAGCARVDSAELVQVDGDEAVLRADLCVEDAKAGTVDRWSGRIRAVSTPAGWAMSKWELGKAGSCRCDR